MAYFSVTNHSDSGKLPEVGQGKQGEATGNQDSSWGSVEDRVQDLPLLSSYGSPQMPSPSCLGRQHPPLWLVGVSQMLGMKIQLKLTVIKLPALQINLPPIGCR